MMKTVSFLRPLSGFAIGRFFLPFFIVMVGFIANAHAINIQKVTSPKGVHAWLVEDNTLPIISLQFSMAGGTTQDPQGKDGLVNLMAGLFDEGAGEIKSEEFQARLDDIGAEMSFSTDRDRMRGSIRVLSDHQQEAFELLALAIQQPRFDQDALDRVRGQLVTRLRALEKSPVTIAQNRLNALIYGKHPYGRRILGTPETLETISRDDLLAAHKAIFAKDDLNIGIVGPVSPEEAGQLLDQIFAPLPEKAKLKKIENVQLNLGGTANVNYDLPQTTLTLVYPGVYRDDPNFFPAYLMDYILGGPGLTSRLFDEVREKRGLAYTVGSNLTINDHSAALVISTGTKASEAQKTLATIREQVKKMADNGVTEQELKDAKSYMIGSYAVQNMGSSSEIASTLVTMQNENLPIDYMEKRENDINAVTLEQIKEIAKKLLSVEPALLVVGPTKNDG
ncbi:M16 family metallopeptidase [Bartonella tamiae]|uniref:Peptidase M16 C-terminal domain-containing protein n=1 Tax=Bartonella tamiae Th239 TaxID=1094558 RepID=J0R542_9HYPH|nr:pitrilysin family protein [Bartonella tamiae]EJF90794.1 hypothetical protein ME5_00630 [Bartonella tamiae Th239]EJF93421.1 hypothetical protein MEG_01252 [Bartonella tamiae Th307]